MSALLSAEARQRSRRRRPAALATILLVAAGAVLVALRPSASDLTDQARAALAAGNAKEARRLALRALELSPGFPRALVTAGEAEASLGRREQALSYYSGVDDDGTLDSIVGLGAAADLLINQGRMSEAEVYLRRILAHDPHHTMANRRLAGILTLSGRRESARYLFELARQGECDVDELALLGNIEQIFDNPELITHFQKLAPDDPLLVLGSARLELHKHHTELAKAQLRQVVQSLPHLLDAHAALGRVLADTGTLDELRAWHQSLPEGADEHPDIWAVRGRWAQREGDVAAATRCYWEAVRRDPNHWKANYQLAQLLLLQGDQVRAEPFLQRADKLKALSDTLLWLHLERTRTDLMLKAARLTEALGRPWESWSWYRLAAKLRPDSVQFQRERDRLRAQLGPEVLQTLVAAHPALAVDLSSFPLPRWKRSETSGRALAGQVTAAGNVSFRNDSASVGLEFAYDNGDDALTPGMRTWESFGGGVGILDFDADGWPDLYFAQAGNLQAAEDPARANRLFRNTGSGRFEDVTKSASVGDRGYGQGVAAGDFNGDGLPDLYVANIGRNGLYRNNGDGTFEDVTDESGIDGSQWTSSCLFADLNHDGHPEIYDVNYLRGHDLFTRICPNEELNNEPRICAPLLFDAEQDRLYLNVGDGRFEDVTSTSGIRAPDGKGLGIIAADFEGAGRLNLFVANDTTANFYFVNQTKGPSAMPRFEEQALVAGCALDFEGKWQACMGIAADDANDDGLLDLYVTNFYNEYNILYLQQPGGLFVDGTGQSGLKEPSVPMLGFGTQFLDAELDGRPDLVVVNGHVDDFTGKGIPFRMAPQYYSNLGSGRFAEITAESLGEYFQKPGLGRGLARADWNRDGREDFIVSHLEAPVSLLTNRTQNVGRHLSLQLRGVQSSRDAVGSVVRVTAGGRTRTRQLTAGDGYYASNERQLVFGLADSPQIEELHVRWPSGREQAFHEIPANSRLLLVEGDSKLVSLP